MNIIKLTRCDESDAVVYVNPYRIQYVNGSWIQFSNNRIIVKETQKQILKLIEDAL